MDESANIVTRATDDQSWFTIHNICRPSTCPEIRTIFV